MAKTGSRQVYYANGCFVASELGGSLFYKGSADIFADNYAQPPVASEHRVYISPSYMHWRLVWLQEGYYIIHAERDKWVQYSIEIAKITGFKQMPGRGLGGDLAFAEYEVIHEFDLKYLSTGTLATIPGQFKPAIRAAAAKTRQAFLDRPVYVRRETESAGFISKRW